MALAQLRRTQAALATILIAASLAGCAALPFNDGASPRGFGPAAEAASTPIFPPTFEAFLTDAPAGTSTVLAESPWGGPVQVQADASYFAASGRTCRPLQVDGPRGLHPALACRAPGRHWEPVRVLAHGHGAGT